MKSFSEYTEPKTLDEILEMDENKANMHLSQLDEDIAIKIVSKALQAVELAAKATYFVGKLAGAGIVKGGKALMQRYAKQAVADRKKAKLTKKKERLVALRTAKEDILAAKERIKDEQDRLNQIAADEKALNKRKIEDAKKKLSDAAKELDKQLKGFKKVKV
jgi:hypothetical protein